MNASDNRRVMDDLPKIKNLRKMVRAFQGTHEPTKGRIFCEWSAGDPFVLVQNLAASALRPW
jgi:hypothetical protein